TERAMERFMLTPPCNLPYQEGLHKHGSGAGRALPMQPIFRDALLPRLSLRRRDAAEVPTSLRPPLAFYPDCRLPEAHRLQVPQADPKTLERIALAGVLLHNVPLHTRLAARLQDGGPVQVTLAHLSHELLAAAHHHVFQ